MFESSDFIARRHVERSDASRPTHVDLRARCVEDDECPFLGAGPVSGGCPTRIGLAVVEYEHFTGRVDDDELSCWAVDPHSHGICRALTRLIAGDEIGRPHTSALVDPGNLVAADCDVARTPLMVAAAETGNERTREWVTLSQTTISSSQLEPEGVPPKVTMLPAVS